ncbi:MAG: HD domain-containing protein [Ignavibacteria bacterium]|nr:HD domain-containing protein [Ignavibacteria bacterium]
MENVDNNNEFNIDIKELNLELKEKQEKIEELQAILDNITTKYANSIYEFISILSSIVAFQEKYYEGSHSRYVSKKAGAVAKALKMSKEDVWITEVAGLLHDIGKVGFKDAILAKFPQELNERETLYYQTHCELGRDILKKFSEFSFIAEIVYQHHELLDGSGFPEGLRGNQIHPSAQIIGIVNYFHNQIYKVRKEVDPRTVNLTAQTTLPPKKVEVGGSNYLTAVASLLQRSGLHYSREFVETFLEIIEEERKSLGQKIIVRVPVQKLEPGMIIYQNYFTKSGLLVAASGDVIDIEAKRALIRLAEFGAIPSNILVLK